MTDVIEMLARAILNAQLSALERRSDGIPIALCLTSPDAIMAEATALHDQIAPTLRAEADRDELAALSGEDRAAIMQAAHEIEQLTARAEKAEAEAEKWQKAFAAQSNKLQRVLHIDGVKAALAPQGADHG